MFDARQSVMRDLTAYAPVRVALTGVWRVLFGLIWAVVAGVLIWIGPSGEAGAPRQPGDMPAWWMFMVGLGLAVVALAFITGGVGRMVSAFAAGCYLRAGEEGMAVRWPKMGWFGSFRMTELAFKWEEIEQIVYFTRSVNMIPVAREIHIRLFGGKEVTIERYYFKANAKRLATQLTALQAQAVR